MSHFLTVARGTAAADHKSARIFYDFRLGSRPVWQCAMHAHAMRSKIHLASGLDLPRQHESQQPRAESLPQWLRDGRAAAFDLVERQRAAHGIDRDAPGHLDFAAVDRQRTVFRRGGGEFMNCHVAGAI